MRGVRSLVVACLTMLLSLAAARPAAAQVAQDARTVRFGITSIADSTFTFAVGDNPWVVKGLRGLAVDPRRNDVLVARFVVTDVARGEATALITGETTRLALQHSILLQAPPERHPHRTAPIAIAAVLGLLVGFVAGRAF